MSSKNAVVLSATLILIFSPLYVYAENIDPLDDGSQYAWGENIGWVNFEPNVAGPNVGATVTDHSVDGFIWSESIGWINLDPNYGGVTNDGEGRLSGLAWGENVGWINFGPNVPDDSNNYGVTIDHEGNFSGWAWAENLGWIHLQSSTPVAYKVQTSWQGIVGTCWDTDTCAGQPFGDATCDGDIGTINLADLFALKASFGINAPWTGNQCCADFNHDGAVNLADLFILKRNFGSIGYSPSIGNQICPHWPPPPEGMVFVYINDPGVAGHEPFNSEMSKYETTNAQYCEFLNDALASGDVIVDGDYVRGAYGSNSGVDFVGEDYYYLAGPGWTGNGATNGGATRINYSGNSFTVDSGFDYHPVTYVSWYGSTAFCNYYGYRLPTEWEWRAVADYNGSYNYGCGTSINNSIANYEDSTHPDGTTAVGSFGTYGYGMCDMAGNGWEWTSSCYYAGCDAGYRVHSGGAWYSSDHNCSVSTRVGSGSNTLIGFRVCR